MANLTIDDLKKDHKTLYDLAKKHRLNQHGRNNTNEPIVDSFNWSHDDAEGYTFWSYVRSGDFIKVYALRPDLKTPSATSSPLTRNGISVGDWYVVTDSTIQIYINNRRELCKKGKVINIIDIEGSKYHLSTTEYIPNLDCVLYRVFKCADKCAAEIYAYELLNPTGVKTIDPIPSISSSVSEYSVAPSKPMSILQAYIDECKVIFKIGDTVRNIYGSVFTIENLDFFEGLSSIEYKGLSTGVNEYTIYSSHWGFAEIISKTKTPLEEALEECKRRYFIGMSITSIMGTTFVIDNVNFKISTKYITLESKTAGNCIVYNPVGNQYATINTVSAIDEAFAECKRRFKPGDKIRSLGGSVFILNDCSIEKSSSYVLVQSQRYEPGGGSFAPNLANVSAYNTIIYAELLEKACDIQPGKSMHDAEGKAYQRKKDILNHIKGTFLRGMSIKTDQGDELDLVGDFTFEIDEDDDCIYLVDEDYNYFCVYDFEDDIYPTIIETIRHPAHVLDIEPGFSFKLYSGTTPTKPIDPLESCLDLLKVKTLAIN